MPPFATWEGLLCIGVRRHPRSKQTKTLLPYTKLFRSEKKKKKKKKKKRERERGRETETERLRDRQTQSTERVTLGLCDLKVISTKSSS